MSSNMLVMDQPTRVLPQLLHYFVNHLFATYLLYVFWARNSHVDIHQREPIIFFVATEYEDRL